MPKRRVFRDCLKESNESPGRRSPGGRSFHNRGPAAEKLLSKKMTVVSKIRGNSTSERLTHEPRDLERESLTNWQLVQLPQQWYDVVTTTGACDQASGSVLHRLKALKKSVTDTIKQ